MEVFYHVGKPDKESGNVKKPNKSLRIIYIFNLID